MTDPSHRRGQIVDTTILAAVIDVIAASGTLSIKVEDVAEVAGVNKTTIYRRYPTREDLVLAAMLAQADTAIPIPDTGSLSEDLLTIAKGVRDTITAPLGRALLSASADLSPELAELRPAFWSLRFSSAAEVVRRAASRGECEPSKEAELLIELMVAPIHFRASQTEGEISDEFLQAQVDRAIAELT